MPVLLVFVNTRIW